MALKTLFNADPEEVKRWHQELRAGQALDHPGIAKILEAGVNARGQPWLAMELVPGESLKQKLDREGPLPPAQVARIGREIASALTHAHEHGIIHRDLKPANVILRPDGQPVVIDLGLAKILNTDLKASRSLSQTGEIMGTPAFMAPEQARGDRRTIGPWTDVWGLGATLYQLATGELPFRGSSGMEILEGVLDRPPAPPRSIRAEISERLEAVILRCLEKEPARRWQSGAEVAELLREARAVRSTAQLKRGHVAAAGAILGTAILAATLIGLRPSAAATAAVPSTPATDAEASSEHEPVITDERLRDLQRQREQAPSPEAREAVAAAFARRTQELALEYMNELLSREPELRDGAEPVTAMQFVARAATRALAPTGQRDPAGAREDLARAATIRPRDPDVFLASGYVRWNMHDEAGAIEDYSVAIEIRPTRLALFLRGVSRVNVRDIEGASQDFSRASISMVKSGS